MNNYPDSECPWTNCFRLLEVNLMSWSSFCPLCLSFLLHEMGRVLRLWETVGIICRSCEMVKHTSWIKFMREDTEFLFIILFLSFPFTPILIAYWFLFPADIRATAYIKTTATEASGKSASLYTIKKSAVWWCTFTTPRSASGKYNHIWRGTSTRWVGFKKALLCMMSNRRIPFKNSEMDELSSTHFIPCFAGHS